jgi:hypothetical protein
METVIELLITKYITSRGLIYWLTAIGLSPGGSSTVHIYTQTIHITTQITINLEECGPCPVFASFTLEFALQLRKKHGKTCQGKKYLSQGKVYTLPKHPYITYTHTHTHTNTRPYITKHTHTHTRPHTHTHTHTHTHKHTHKHTPIHYKTPTHTHTHTHITKQYKTKQYNIQPQGLKTRRNL